ncbi:hypothetical protein CLU79DRAFT_767811 [Phycomyces nitens]|nr:hypothetical protein CLU79DRAFT_767811 [Phycomyces nitens]
MINICCINSTFLFKKNNTSQFTNSFFIYSYLHLPRSPVLSLCNFVCSARTSQ